MSKKIKTAYKWRVHKRSCAYHCPEPNCPRDPMRGRNIRVFCDYKSGIFSSNLVMVFVNH